MVKSNGSNRRILLIIATVFIAVAVIGTVVGLTLGLRTKKSDEETDVTEVTEVPDVTEVPEVPGGQEGFRSAYNRYRYAAVTTDTKNHCSKQATDILGSQRGSAVDAAIVAFLCNCIVSMQSCGIGGGHIATIYAKNSTGGRAVHALMARERAPAAATGDMFVNDTRAAVFGGLAIGVPGEIHGFHTAHKLYGKMAWSDLFTDVIRMLTDGFVVEPSLASNIRNNNATIRDDPNLRDIFLKEDGSLLGEGDLFKDVKLAATFSRIAADPMAFYTGSLAGDIVADIAEYGGIITREDLANYTSTIKEPLRVKLSNGGYTLYNPPPPASGAVFDFILGVLDGYNFSSHDISDTERKITTYHRITEAFKFAYAKRSQLGDEDFVNVTELLHNLTDSTYWSDIRSQIKDSHTYNDVRYYGPTFEIVGDHGTSHVNVLGPDGSAVSITGTINLIFGSKCRGSRTGIIFNNEMDDFSTPGLTNAFGVPPSPSNFIVPGKMPMSSTTPTIVEDSEGRVVFMSGAAGGTRITTATAFVLMNSLWFGLDLGNSSDTARIHHQLLANELVHENYLNQRIREGLQSKNHTLTTASSIAVVNSIRSFCPVTSQSSPTNQKDRTVDKQLDELNCIEAVSDGRKGGVPDGF